MANINYDEIKDTFKTQLESSKVPYRALLALVACGLNLVYPLVDLEWKKGKKLYKNMIIDTIKYIEARGNKSSNYDGMKSVICGTSLPLVWKTADESGAKISASIAATTNSAYELSQLSLKSNSLTKIRTQVAEIYVACFQVVHLFGIEYDPKLVTAPRVKYLTLLTFSQSSCLCCHRIRIISNVRSSDEHPRHYR